MTYTCKNKPLIIFDLDGTILDTIKDINTAINVALDYFNFPNRRVEDTRIEMGKGIINLLTKSFPKNTNQEIINKGIEIFKQYYINHPIVFTKPYDQINECLKELNKRGYTLAIATNKNEILANKILTVLLPNTFHYILGHIEGNPRKPDPFIINKIRDELNIKNKDIIYIGDTNIDYQTAINANVDYLLVTYGYRTKEELLNYKIKAHFISEPKQLLDIFL